MPEARDEHGYPSNPRALSSLAWYYEQKDGLVVCQQPAKGVDAVLVTIPWRRIESAVKRHHRAKSAKNTG